MLATKHHPNGGATAHYDNHKIESLITQYQATRDLESLSTIVALSQDRAETLIRFYRTTRYKPLDELLSDVNFKLARAVVKFDPAKGSAFTFVSQVISNALFTSVSTARRERERYRKLSQGVLDQLVSPSEIEAKHAVNDLTDRIKAGARTTLTDETELSVQRWYIESFTDDRFESRRHECANAAMVIYPLSHGRSRELYDLTMLEVRRVLYDYVTQRRQPIAAGRLLGTRQAWMSRYAPLMDTQEFTKFAVLMRDLAPYLVLLVAANGNRRADRSPAVGRKNIELILYGDPAAMPLFR